MKGLVITPYGDVSELDDISLSSLQKAVKGDIEVIASGIQGGGDESVSFFINEEGKFDLKENPANPFGQVVFADYGGRLGSLDFLAGNVVVTGGVDEDGNTMPISENEAKHIRGVLARMSYMVGVA